MSLDLRPAELRQQERRPEGERQQPGRHPERPHARDLVGGDGDSRFDFGLDVLVDGVARHVGE